MANREKHYIINISPMIWKKVSTNHKFFEGQHADRVQFELHITSQHNDEPLFSSCIEIDMVFHMPISLLKKNRITKGFHSILPAIDDLQKFVLTSLKGTVITDERIISKIHCTKIYSPQPRTEFTIREI